MSILFPLPETVAVPLGRARSSFPGLPLPVGGVLAALGFPSPAEDFEDDALDLNDLLVRNPPATFLYRASGHSMLLVGICDGDILVVDRSVSPVDGDVVLAVYEGNQPTCKVLRVFADHIELHSRNPHHPNIVLATGTEVEIFAITGVARQMRRGKGR